MTREELAVLTTETPSVEGPVKIYRPAFSQNPQDRTLLYGYDCDRNTFHVYLKDELVHLVVYRGLENDPVVALTEFDSLADLAPSKRIYPEASDFEFCQFLKSEGVWLSFTTYGKDREPKQFYGRVAHEA